MTCWNLEGKEGNEAILKLPVKVLCTLSYKLYFVLWEEMGVGNSNRSSRIAARRSMRRKRLLPLKC